MGGVTVTVESGRRAGARNTLAGGGVTPQVWSSSASKTDCSGAFAGTSESPNS